MMLRPYQDEGATFIYENDRSLILAPVGSGKTALTLTAISEMLRDGVCRRVLVVAPKRVAESVWQQEAAIWTPGLQVAIAVGDPAARRLALGSAAPVVVTNYDNLQWLAEQGLDFDAVVFDELTRLKNPSGKRFKAFLKVVDRINIRIGLTGSFTSNGLEDVFGQVKIVDQMLLGRSKGAFLQQYFVLINPDYGQWAPRLGSLEKVMARIKPSTFVLDPGAYSHEGKPNIVSVYCDMERKEYEQMKKKMRVDFADAHVVAVNSGVITGKLKQMASGWVYDSKRFPNPDAPGKWIITQTPIMFSDHKYVALDALLEENQRANTLLFFWYQEELAELKRRYPHARTIDEPGVIADWNAGKVELLLLHPRSAGHGLNLQYGGHIAVFLTLPFYSQELFEQAYGRLHRTGQTKQVWVYVLLTRNTVDELEWAALDNKSALSAIANEALK